MKVVNINGIAMLSVIPNVISQYKIVLWIFRICANRFEVAECSGLVDHKRVRAGLSTEL